jgi:hypothetical protein
MIVITQLVTKLAPYGTKRGGDSVVGTATGYGLDDRGAGVRVPVESKVFFSPRRPNRFWGPLNGYRGFFPRGKSAGAEVDHSPPDSAEVKKM